MQVMVRYIDDHKDRFGAEPICAVLPIARRHTMSTSCERASRIVSSHESSVMKR